MHIHGNQQIIDGIGLCGKQKAPFVHSGQLILPDSIEEVTEFDLFRTQLDIVFGNPAQIQDIIDGFRHISTRHGDLV